MSISNVKNGSHVQYGITDFVIDSTSELTSLPTAITMGSKAFCIEDNKYYILNGQKEWVECAAGGGGGGSSEDLQTAVENFAPAYDPTETYSVGDLVVYEYVLYKCTTAVTTPEDFDDTKWEHTTLESSFEIDDSDVSAVKTWSSSKLSELTLPDATSSDKNKLISVDGSGNYELRSTIDIGRKANTTIGTNSTAEGLGTEASGNYSHAEGYYTVASDNYAHAEGDGAQARGTYSHAEGYNSITGTNGSGAHAEGSSTQANGNSSHAEGYGTVAGAEYAHAEGSSTQALGEKSHTEGNFTTAAPGAHYSHAEGNHTATNAIGAHAEGNSTVASGEYSHAEGSDTTASGYESHAEGLGTTANHLSQHVFGKYNVLDNSTAQAYENGNYIEIVGNGTGTSARSNARTLDWSGNETLAGKLTVGAAPTNNMDVTTKQYVDVVDAKATSAVNTINNLLAPQAQKVYEWDFTNSLTEQIQGQITATLQGTATRDSSGVHFATNGHAQVEVPTILTTSRLYEIKFGEVNITDRRNPKCLFSFEGTNSYGTWSGFGIDTDGKWKIMDYVNYRHVLVNDTIEPNAINNGTISFCFTAPQTLSLYINGQSLGSFPFTFSGLQNTLLRIGNGNHFGAFVVTVKNFNVYSSTTNGEDILNRIEDLEDANTSYNSFITGTILTGEDTLTIQNASITSSTMFDIYSSVYSIVPDEVTVATGSITLSFDTAVESDVTYKIRLIEG